MPPDPPRRRRPPRRPAQPAVGPDDLLPLLLAPSAPVAARGPAVHHRRPRRPGRARRRARRPLHRRGRYDRLPGTSEAEVAFVVADEHQGRGLGTLLLEHLAAAARERGITRSSPRRWPTTGDAGACSSEPAGRRRASGPTASCTSSSPSSRRRRRWRSQHAREHRADARSVAPAAAPDARSRWSARAASPARSATQVFRNLLDGGFTGPVYPVNREAVVGRRAWRRGRRCSTCPTSSTSS